MDDVIFMGSSFNQGNKTPYASPASSDFDNTLNKNISSILSLLESPSEGDTPERRATNVLKDVVAYVEVRSVGGTANMSRAIMKELANLGATVVTKFTAGVTHVVYKEGRKSTHDKAVKKGIHLVSVLWVESCKESNSHVTENLYPVVSDDRSTPLLVRLKKARSMQPKDFEQEVARSAERQEKKRRRMATSSTRDQVQMSASPLVLKMQKAHYVEETQPQSPVDIFAPEVTVPDTPPSMKGKLAHLKPDQKQHLSSAPGDYTSPLAARIGADVIQKRLFEPTDESVCTCELTPEKHMPCHPLGSPHHHHPCDTEKHRRHSHDHSVEDSVPLCPSFSTTPVPDSVFTCPKHSPSPLSPTAARKSPKLMKTPQANLFKNTLDKDAFLFDEEDPIPPNLLNPKPTSRKRKLLSNTALEPASQLLAPTKASNAAQEKKGILGTPKAKRKTSKGHTRKKTKSVDKPVSVTAAESGDVTEPAGKSMPPMSKMDRKLSEKETGGIVNRSVKRRKSVHVMLPVSDIASGSLTDMVVPETVEKPVKSKSVRRKSMHYSNMSTIADSESSPTLENLKRKSRMSKSKGVEQISDGSSKKSPQRKSVAFSGDKEESDIGSKKAAENPTSDEKISSEKINPGVKTNRRKSVRIKLPDSCSDKSDKDQASGTDTEIKPNTRRKSSAADLVKSAASSASVTPAKDATPVAKHRRSMRLVTPGIDGEGRKQTGVDSPARGDMSSMYESMAYPSTLLSLTQSRRSIDEFNLAKRRATKPCKPSKTSLSNLSTKTTSLRSSDKERHNRSSSSSSADSLKGVQSMPKHWKKVELPATPGEAPQQSIVMTSLHTA